MDTLLLPNSLYVISFSVSNFNSNIDVQFICKFLFLRILQIPRRSVGDNLEISIYYFVKKLSESFFLEKATFLNPWPMEDHDRWKMGFQGWVKVNVIKLASILIDWQNWKRTWSVFTQLSKSTENATSLGVLPGQNGQGVTWTDMVYMYHQKEIRKQVPVGPILNYWV